ncbi:MAG: hypothetical protein GY791_05185 [Alphaproteobacteria bacterium]|nr:hypothetical protein [Alphaproteobacteria bacterium]
MRRPKSDAEASGEDGNDADARPNATLSGRDLFRHDGVNRLDRMPDTLSGAFLVMAKNASGRMVLHGHIVLYFMVGMTNSAPARMPVGQREVMVFILV